jgi:hypothetical protein
MNPHTITDKYTFNCHCERTTVPIGKTTSSLPPRFAVRTCPPLRPAFADIDREQDGVLQLRDGDSFARFRIPRLLFESFTSALPLPGFYKRMQFIIDASSQFPFHSPSPRRQRHSRRCAPIAANDTCRAIAIAHNMRLPFVDRRGHCETTHKAGSNRIRIRDVGCRLGGVLKNIEMNA